MSHDVNRKYGGALLDTLSAYADAADEGKWYRMALEYKEPWLAVINCAAYFMAFHIHSWQEYAKFEVSSALAWNNLDEDPDFRGLVHLADLPDRDAPRILSCVWAPTDDKGNATDFKRATGGTLSVIENATVEQHKTVVTVKDGKWVVWTYKLDAPQGGGGYGRGRYRGHRGGLVRGNYGY